MIKVEKWAQGGAMFGAIFAFGVMMLLEAKNVGSAFYFGGAALGGMFGVLSALVARKLGIGFGTFVMLGFCIGALAAIGSTPSAMPYDEHMVRGGILGAAWWLIALFVALAAAGIRGMFRMGRRVTQGLLDGTSTRDVGSRLDEIEALYAAGKITDVERVEARARLLVAGR